MATIKSYTDISQSKILSEILPLEGADMVLLHEEPYETSDSKFDGLHQALCVPFSKYDKSWRQKYKNISYFPCWSLASLLDVIPCGQVNRMANSDKWEASSWNDSDFEPAYYVEDYDNPIDACYEMILKLKGLKML